MKKFENPVTEALRLLFGMNFGLYGVEICF